MSAIRSLIERYLVLWLIVISAAAFHANRIFSVDVFVESKPLLPWLIFATMFAIGWMLPHDEIQQVLARWPSVLGGTAIQYISMPILAYVIANQFQLEDSLFIGMIMVGCVPGAMASNVLTLVARGNTGYSVSLTTTATLLSPLVVPFALRLALGESVEPSIFWRSAVKLSWMVVLPVVAGHIGSRQFPGRNEAATASGSIIANLTILWIIAYVVADNRDSLALLQGRVVVALLLLNLAGYAAGFLGGRAMGLPTGMRRALTLEVGMQNAGLGTVLVTGLFPDDPLVAVPPAIYTFGCMLSGTVLARFWSSFRRADEGVEP